MHGSPDGRPHCCTTLRGHQMARSSRADESTLQPVGPPLHPPICNAETVDESLPPLGEVRRQRLRRLVHRASQVLYALHTALVGTIPPSIIAGCHLHLFEDIQTSMRRSRRGVIVRCPRFAV
jgi:hypothetical protein